jgi:hypothetical protein
VDPNPLTHFELRTGVSRGGRIRSPRCTRRCPHAAAWIVDDLIDEAKQAALAKKSLPTISEIRRETLEEGTSAQLLHLGPYDDEGPVLARLHREYLTADNLRMSGHHHEIYLSDQRRTEPAKLKTILRQPVQKAS